MGSVSDSAEKGSGGPGGQKLERKSWCAPQVVMANSILVMCQDHTQLAEK